MINGKNYDWNDVSINFPYGTLVQVEDISYDDEQEKSMTYGKGPVGQSYGKGNYKASAKVTLLYEEYEKLMNYAKIQKKGLYSLSPFPITVSFADDGQPISTDVLEGCTFTKRSHKAGQGNQKLTVDLDILITGQIKHNGVAAI